MSSLTSVPTPSAGIPSSLSSTSTSSSAASPTPNSGPRGLAYNQSNLTLPFSLSDQHSKVSWAYNWYSFPYTLNQPQTGYNPVLEFIPQLWSTADDLTSVWNANVEKSMAEYGTKSVIAFNEPDLCIVDTACMTVTTAVEGWTEWMEPLKGKVQLGAPGVSNSATDGMGLDWLKEFLEKCEDCTIDFVPVHWYGSAMEVEAFIKFVGEAFLVGGGRRLWITEFGTQGGTAEQKLRFLKEALRFLDGPGKAMVDRYAWFMDAPGNLINDDGTGLSQLGELYNSGGGYLR